MEQFIGSFHSYHHLLLTYCDQSRTGFECQLLLLLPKKRNPYTAVE